MKGSDAARYVNDAIYFERRENAIFKLLPSLRRSRRYLQLDAQLRVVVVLDRHTQTRPSTVTLAVGAWDRDRECPMASFSDALLIAGCLLSRGGDGSSVRWAVKVRGDDNSLEERARELAEEHGLLFVDVSTRFQTYSSWSSLVN